MKKVFISFFFAMGLSVVCVAQANPSEQQSTSEQSVIETKEVAVVDQNEIVAQSGDTMSSGCMALSADQQNFAMQLNPTNKNMFCNAFNMNQRKSAMDMMGKMGKNGASVTSDQAVEQVAKNNNMTPMAPGQQPTQKGACPVR